MFRTISPLDQNAFDVIFKKLFDAPLVFKYAVLRSLSRKEQTHFNVAGAATQCCSGSNFERSVSRSVKT
jgi:hypothetical protein